MEGTGSRLGWDGAILVQVLNSWHSLSMSIEIPGHKTVDCAVHHTTRTLVCIVQGLEDLNAERWWDNNPIQVHDDIVKDMKSISVIPKLLMLFVEVRFVGGESLLNCAQ